MNEPLPPLTPTFVFTGRPGHVRVYHGYADRGAHDGAARGAGGITAGARSEEEAVEKGRRFLRRAAAAGR